MFVGLKSVDGVRSSIGCCFRGLESDTGDEGRSVAFGDGLLRLKESVILMINVRLLHIPAVAEFWGCRCNHEEPKQRWQSGGFQFEMATSGFQIIELT